MQRTNKYLYRLVDSEGKLVYEGSALSISLKYFTNTNYVYDAYTNNRMFMGQYKIEKRENPEYNITRLTPIKPYKKNGKLYCSNCDYEIRNTWVCCPNCEWRVDNGTDRKRLIKSNH